MHILLFPVVEQQSTVLEMTAHVDAVFFKEIPDDGVSQLAQVAGDDQVIVLGLGLGVPEKGGQGVISGGGKCQGYTITF